MSEVCFAAESVFVSGCGCTLMRGGGTRQAVDVRAHRRQCDAMQRIVRVGVKIPCCDVLCGWGAHIYDLRISRVRARRVGC